MYIPPNSDLGTVTGPLPVKKELHSKLLSDKNGEYVLLPVLIKQLWPMENTKFYVNHKNFLKKYGEFMKEA